MKRLALLTTLAITQTLALALLPLPATAAEIAGTVSNKTTGRPAADISVSLLALERQLSTVAETVTDAEGRYRLVVDAGPEERFLVQASYGGANYNRPVVLFSDGTTTVDVTVYESGAGLGDLDIQQHIVFLSRGDRLLVVTEIFNVLNRTEPPRSFVPDQEGFRFALPEGAQDLEVSVSTPSGMPLRKNTSIDRFVK